MQELIEADAAERIGADPYVRTETRTTERNGHRPRLVTTQAGDVQLRIPTLSDCRPSMASVATGVQRDAALRCDEVDAVHGLKGCGCHWRASEVGDHSPPHPSGCGYPLGGRRPVTALSSV